jgi:hypothetical protein
MLKSKNFFLTFLFVSYFSVAQNRIIFKEIKNTSDCHNCSGKLIVSNGIKTDTIYGGEWGNPPSYHLKNIDGNDMLIVDTTYSFAGGEKRMYLQLYSLNDNSFLNKIFEKDILLYSERNVNENGISTNYTYKNNPIINYQKPIKITNQITREKCPEIDDLKCTLLKKHTKIHYFWSPFVK